LTAITRSKSVHDPPHPPVEAGVVEEEVHPAVLVDGALHVADRVLLHADVGRHRQDRAQLSPGALELRLVPVDQRHPGPVAQQARADRPAQGPRSPRDDCDPALEIGHCVVLLRA